MIYVVLIFLWLSLLIYLIMGGADFGTGILELFTPGEKKTRLKQTSYEAIGPIWEANHMWLIIAVVVLFVGFPEMYVVVSVYLYIPLLMLLIGIIARGTAFTFRNYDAVKDNMEKIYNRIYVCSSFLTPLFLGIIAGSIVSGRIDVHSASFIDAYIMSWLGLFPIAVGLFTVALCAFLAAIYLIGKVDGKWNKQHFILAAKIANLAMVICVAFIFISARYEHIPLTDWLFTNRTGTLSISFAVGSYVLMWVSVFRDEIIKMRFCLCIMVTALLIAVTYSHFPDVVLLKSGGRLSFLKNRAPDQTINLLGDALLIGSVLILPSLCYLVLSFRKKTA